MNRHLLDNVAWHSLAGDHVRHAEGDAQVRRYRAGFAPIAAFAHPTEADIALLSRLFAPGESCYVAGFVGEPGRASSWRSLDTIEAQQMLWTGRRVPRVAAALALRPLSLADAAAMTELAAVAAPGPFGVRSVELGRFHGAFDDAGRLVAMAGQRLRAGGFVELSAVCTHPSHRGRGLARGLIASLLADCALAGESAFLHVAERNTAAIALYHSMGFARRRGVTLSLLRRGPHAAAANCAAAALAA